MNEINNLFHWITGKDLRMWRLNSYNNSKLNCSEVSDNSYLSLGSKK